MEENLMEQINLAIVKGTQCYHHWARNQGMTDYVGSILYDLYTHDQLTQKELTLRSGLPKQSISKGIKQLEQDGWLIRYADEHDRRIKYCQLTALGRKAATPKIAPLVKLENQIIEQLGTDKVKQVLDSIQQWNELFVQELKAGD